MTSGGLEPVVDKGGGGHSVFANAFIGALRENVDVLEGRRLFEHLRGPVALNAPQTPEYADIREAGHANGEFLFVPTNFKGGGAVERPVEAQSRKPPLTKERERQLVFDEREAELLFWKSVKDSDDPAMFEAYLRKFPEGVFADLAKLKRDVLRKDEASKAEGKETVPESHGRTVTPVAPKKIEIDSMDMDFVAVRNANMRAEPNAESPKVGFLTHGTRVTVTGKVKGADWFRVAQDDGGIAYVYARLLAEPPQPSRLAEPRKTAPKSSDPSLVETAFWESIRDSDVPELFLAYERKYPDGNFVALAKKRRAALEAERRQEAEAAASAERERQADAEAERKRTAAIVVPPKRVPVPDSKAFYGAFYVGSGKEFGVSSNAHNVEEAKRIAKEKCDQQTSGCKLVTSYSGCLAIVGKFGGGKPQWHTQRALTRGVHELKL